MPESSGFNDDTPPFGLATQLRDRVAVRTRRQRYSGGVGDQTAPIRNRPEDLQSGAGTSGTGGTGLRTETTQHGQRNRPSNTNDVVETPENDAEAIAPPASGGNRPGKVRFKWSLEMNIYLYRAYLLLTRMQTSTEPFAHRLHQEMITKFPEIQHKTVQNILDQRRQLFLRNRLPLDTIRQIRAEVAEQLGLTVADVRANEEDRTNILE